jgi:hypothetical protein
MGYNGSFLVMKMSLTCIRTSSTMYMSHDDVDVVHIQGVQQFQGFAILQVSLIHPHMNTLPVKCVQIGVVHCLYRV